MKGRARIPQKGTWPCLISTFLKRWYSISDWNVNVGAELLGFAPLPSKYLGISLVRLSNLLSMNFSSHKVGIMRAVILCGTVLKRWCTICKVQQPEQQRFDV